MKASNDASGCGGVKVGEEDESATTLFFMDNEKTNSYASSSVSGKSNMFLRRRRRVDPDSKVDSSSPVPTPESRKAFEKIRQKVSAINNPYGEVNNNNVKIGGLHSTPATCVNGGSEPSRGDEKGDSGFIDQTGSGRSNSFYTSRPDTINRSGIDTPPVRKLDTARSPVRHLHDAFTSASSKKKRLFESTSRHQVILFGVKFKIDDVIPLLVVAFVAITAIVTLTTLTGALKRAHVLPKMEPANQNGKYRSLKYAHEQKKQFDSGVDLSVHDDEGNRLGGKRASIKFAHDRIRATDSGANDVEDNLSVNGDNYLDAADLLNTIKTLSPSVSTIHEENPSTHKSARIEKRRRVIMKKSRKSSPIQAYGQQAATSSAEVTKAELLDTITNTDGEEKTVAALSM